MARLGRVAQTGAIVGAMGAGVVCVAPTVAGTVGGVALTLAGAIVLLSAGFLWVLETAPERAERAAVRAAYRAERMAERAALRAEILAGAVARARVALNVDATSGEVLEVDGVRFVVDGDAPADDDAESLEVAEESR